LAGDTARPTTRQILQEVSPGSPGAPPHPQTGGNPSPTDGLEGAQQLVQRGQLREAEAWLREYLAHHSDSADAHYLLGYVLFREVQMGASLAAESRGAQYNDLSTSLAHLAKANAEASLAEYTAGARYRKPGADDLKIVALDYVILKDFVDADKWLTRALESNPNDSEGWYYLGRAKYNENRFEEAVHAFSECLRLDPANAKAEDNLGLSHEALGRIEEAKAAYRKAIDWQAQTTNVKPDAGPFLDLGSLLLDQHDAQGAIVYLLRAADISPQAARTHEKLGKAYSDLNRLPEAQQQLEKAVQLSPENPSLHFLLGQVYRKEGQMQKARAEFERSASLSSARAVP
jgi:tetratricopeptide (TPR) repeat protein